MVAARNLEASFIADSPYAGTPTAKLYGRDKYDGMPRYDSRFAAHYARSIMQVAGYFPELYAEAHARARNDNAALRDHRSDAGLPMAFARSLEYIIRKPYEAEYPELRAKEFIPVMTEVSPEALAFTYRMLDKTGTAKIINENGSDAPKVDIKGDEWQQPIVTLGASYDYTILDTMRAAKLGIPLEAYKAEAARFAIEYLIEQLAAVGNPNVGLVGLTNAPGIIASPQVSSGGNWITQVRSIGSAATTNATNPAITVAQNIVSDINAAAGAIFQATNGVHYPDTCLIPVTAYNVLNTAPRSPGFTDDTLLQYIEKLTGLQIECWPQLNNAGGTQTTVTSGAYAGTYSGRVMVYKRDPKILSLVIPQPFTQLPPQAIRMAWEVTTWARTGAVQVRFPKAVAFIDAVS